NEALTLDPAGRLYLSSSYGSTTTESRLWSCDMSINSPAHDTDSLNCTEWTTASAQARRVTGMAANSGYVYVVSNDIPDIQASQACATNGKIVVINSSTGAVESTYTGTLSCPVDIDIDSAGFLYVADKGTGDIHKLSTNNGPSISLHSVIPNMGSVTGVSVSTNGNKIYAADFGASVYRKLWCLDQNRAPQTDPVGFWKFDESTLASPLANSSPSFDPEYPLTLIRNGVTVVSGHSGNARNITDLTQTNERYIRDASLDPLQYLRPSDGQQLTVMAWVKHNGGDPAKYMNIASYSNMKFIYSANEAFTTGYGLYANKNPDNGPVGYGFFVKDMTNRVTFPTTHNTDWHHVAAVYNGSTYPKTMKLYVDGVASSTVNSTLPLVYETLPSWEPPQFTVMSALTSGLGSSGNFAFHGTVDDVRMYNRALTDSEIAAIFGGPIITNTPTPPVVTSTPVPTNTLTPTATPTPPVTLPICQGMEVAPAGFSSASDVQWYMVNPSPYQYLHSVWLSWPAAFVANSRLLSIVRFGNGVYGDTNILWTGSLGSSPFNNSVWISGGDRYFPPLSSQMFHFLAFTWERDLTVNGTFYPYTLVTRWASSLTGPAVCQSSPSVVQR
ncbi:MAG: LamG-like jellyroll fold domain-containing protein, partial [Patescibacteria group bacterium]